MDHTACSSHRVSSRGSVTNMNRHSQLDTASMSVAELESPGLRGEIRKSGLQQGWLGSGRGMVWPTVTCSSLADAVEGG